MNRLRLALALLLWLVAAGAIAEETTVLLVRHAEKLLTGGDVDLSEPGGRRAADLVVAVEHAGISVAIASTYRRTQQTVAPTVAALGLAEERVLRILEPGDVAREILTNQRGRTILVAGHSNTVPQIVEALGAPSLCPPFEIDKKYGCMIPDPEYDHLFVVRIPADGAVSVVRVRYGDPSP